MSYERDLSVSRATSSIRNVVGAEVLVVDKDERVQAGMVELLARASLNVTCVSTADAALEQLARRFFSVVVIDLDTPTPSGGLLTITEVKATSPTSMIVLLTPRKSFDDATRAIRAGAIDIVFKAPESVPYLEERIKEAASRSVTAREVTTILTDARDSHDEFLKLFMDAERRAMDSTDRLAGRDPERVSEFDEIRLLVVAPDDGLVRALTSRSPAGYSFQSAVTGGQALDLCGSRLYHYVLVSEGLPDLPASMVIRSIKGQSPESVVLSFSGPGPAGSIEIVETAKTTTLIAQFTDPGQLLTRLDELAEAFRAKSRERRYAQAFRERHYDFLRRYIDLKTKIEKALAGLSSG